MNYLGANMKLIVECSQKLVRLGENLWGKEQKLDKEMQEHQKLCDEIMAIQGIEPIEAEIEEVWHCPEGYIFKDENGNVINATKIVLEKKKKEYPKTYEECCKILDIIDNRPPWHGYRSVQLKIFQKLLICRDAYWKIAGEEMGLDGHWEPDSFHQVFSIGRISGTLIGKALRHNGKTAVLEFPTAEMRDAFYENFKELIEECKELL